MPGPVAYNPSDPYQRSFLSALRLGESGSNGTAFTGFGGVDTSGAPRDEYGFPQWAGSNTSAGPTHAAGPYQFQPGTWKSIASKYGLNFSNQSDQDAGAWYLAQQVYSQKTGGDLQTALQNGEFSSVQTALASTWTSVTGNSAAPQGLAHSLANGIGADMGAATLAPVSGGGLLGGLSNIGSQVESLFVRGGMIMVGALIILVAIYMLMVKQGAAPSPTQIVKAVT